MDSDISYMSQHILVDGYNEWTNILGFLGGQSRAMYQLQNVQEFEKATDSQPQYFPIIAFLLHGLPPQKVYRSNINILYMDAF